MGLWGGVASNSFSGAAYPYSIQSPWTWETQAVAGQPTASNSFSGATYPYSIQSPWTQQTQAVAGQTTAGGTLFGYARHQAAQPFGYWGQNGRTAPISGANPVGART